MKVKIEIEGNGAAFFDDLDNINHEAFAKVIYSAGTKILKRNYSESGDWIPLFDTNGNRCGFIEITEG